MVVLIAVNIDSRRRNLADRPKFPGRIRTVEHMDVVTLGALLDALDSAVVGLLEAPTGDDVVVTTAELVDGDELVAGRNARTPLSDVYLLVGVHEDDAVTWLHSLGSTAPEARPKVVMTKHAARRSSMAAAARRAGVALVAVHPDARWNQLFPLIQRVLRRTRVGDPDLLAAETDLFDLARITADNASGMVSIEDVHSHVLAYSASDETADELRTLSILGREGPQDYLRALRDWGVFDRLRDSDDVVDIPPHDELGTEHRLAVSIRQPSLDGTLPPRNLGTIWLQQGNTAFADDAADVLRGASAIAATLISRTLDASTTHGLLIQRLFGARGTGVDVPSIASALGLPVDGPGAVVGFALVPGSSAPVADLATMGSALRLHASAFRRDSIATIVDERAYVLLPRYSSPTAVTAWTRQLVAHFETRYRAILHAAIALDIEHLGGVAAARSEVDRVLNGTATSTTSTRVTTLAESMTAVLLGESLTVLHSHPELHDPRVQALFEYDENKGSSLRQSVEAFLHEHGDVRAAARRVQVHPNTLRYRLRRVEQIVGIDLSDRDDRLLLELQLSLPRNSPWR